MTGAVLVAGALLGFTVAAAVALVWVAGRETLAEFPDTDTGHDPGCDVCHWADDLGVAEPIDWALWSAEMQERQP